MNSVSKARLTAVLFGAAMVGIELPSKLANLKDSSAITRDDAEFYVRWVCCKLRTRIILARVIVELMIKKGKEDNIWLEILWEMLKSAEKWCTEFCDMIPGGIDCNKPDEPPPEQPKPPPIPSPEPPPDGGKPPERPDLPPFPFSR